MSSRLIALPLVLAGAFILSGCSKQGPATDAATAAVSAAAPAATKVRGKACDMVTEAEMSAILGGAVAAAPGGNERPPSSTECIYSSIDGPAPIWEPQSYAEGQAIAGPYAEIQVDWGGGDPQTMDTSVGLINRAAPTAAVDPLAGLGDRAYQVTPTQVFISLNGDLMMIRFAPRADDVIAKARRIFETAKGRL